MLQKYPYTRMEGCRTYWTRLYDKTNTLISESYKDYSLDETNINNIKISHMLKNKDDYTNIKYISFEVE